MACSPQEIYGNLPSLKFEDLQLHRWYVFEADLHHPQRIYFWVAKLPEENNCFWHYYSFHPERETVSSNGMRLPSDGYEKYTYLDLTHLFVSPLVWEPEPDMLDWIKI
jgi:hypothetical protein